MVTLRNELETIFLISLVSLTTLLVFQFHQPKKNNTISFAVETITSTINPTPHVTPFLFIPKITTSTATSADGKVKIIMNTKENKNSTITYTFFLNSVEKNMPFFTEVASGSTTLVLPFNSWSPDNAYFYIEEINPSVTHAFVFKASGEIFLNGQQYVDILPLFTKKIRTHSLKELTGWASDTLLIINTIDDTGEQGQSYWFDVTSQSFIGLSTKF